MFKAALCNSGHHSTAPKGGACTKLRNREEELNEVKIKRAKRVNKDIVVETEAEQTNRKESKTWLKKT